MRRLALLVCLCSLASCSDSSWKPDPAERRLGDEEPALDTSKSRRLTQVTPEIPPSDGWEEDAAEPSTPDVKVEATTAGDTRVAAESCPPRRPLCTSDEDGGLPPAGCPSPCDVPRGVVLLSEIVARPTGAEMIEIYNPTRSPIDLSSYGLTDTDAYRTYLVGDQAISPSDFVALFPTGSVIGPHEFRTVGLSSNATSHFTTTYGFVPDFSLHASASDGPATSRMRSARPTKTSVGSLAGLTDGGEAVILFSLAPAGASAGAAAPSTYEVDAVAYGDFVAASGTIAGVGGALAWATLTPLPATSEGGSLHRCRVEEVGEKAGDGGVVDPTREQLAVTFAVNLNDSARRTPGAPPPEALCAALPHLPAGASGASPEQTKTQPLTPP